MEEKRKAKTTNIEEVYMEKICDEILDLQRKGRYDLKYQKA